MLLKLRCDMENDVPLQCKPTLPKLKWTSDTEMVDPPPMTRPSVICLLEHGQFINFGRRTCMSALRHVDLHIYLRCMLDTCFLTQNSVKAYQSAVLSNSPAQGREASAPSVRRSVQDDVFDFNLSAASLTMLIS